MQSGDATGEPTDQPFPERTIPVLLDDDDPPARGFLAASLVAGKGIELLARRSTVAQRRDLIAAVRDLARGALADRGCDRPADGPQPCQNYLLET